MSRRGDADLRKVWFSCSHRHQGSTAAYATTAFASEPSSSSSCGSLNSSGGIIRIQVLFWYVVFGILHELVHVTTIFMFGFGGNGDGTAPSPALTTSKGMMTFLVRSVLGRACHMEITLEEQHHQNFAWELAFIEHSGWLFSVGLVVVLHLFNRNKKKVSAKFIDDMKLAAIVTAIEAICTDLLHFGTISGINHTDDGGMVTKFVFYCGNFGVILLSPAWTTTPGDRGKTALTLLEKMIEVTMMRGAQTGGVITWIHRGSTKGGAGIANNKGIRCRVVNGKRTDLSKKLRAKLDSDICTTDGGSIESSVRCMLGHTRFATTSKATFDGTHPHRWSKPEIRHVYPLDDKHLWGKSKSPKSVVQSVENYITHNGDLDFFKCNGKHADLESIQSWLEGATGYEMPCSVDSAASTCTPNMILFALIFFDFAWLFLLT